MLRCPCRCPEPTPGLAASGAPEDRRAFFGKGLETLEIVTAVVCLPSQPLDAFVHLRRDGLVVHKDTELFLDDRYGQRRFRRHGGGQAEGELFEFGRSEE